MNDDPTFDDRLRSGLQAVADAAGDPPPFPVAQATNGTPPGWPRPLLAAAALVVVAAIGVALVVATGDDGSGQRVTAGVTTSKVPDASFVGTEWWLSSAIDDQGHPVPIRALRLTVSNRADCSGDDLGCPDRPHLRAGDGCNGIARLATIGPRTIVVGARFGVMTAMACQSPIQQLVESFFDGATAFRYAVRGHELAITAPGRRARLVYETAEDPFGPTDAAIVDRGVERHTAYRLTWDDGDLGFTATSTLPGHATRGALRVERVPGEISISFGRAGGRAYLFGLVPRTATRVVYEPKGKASVELTIHRLGSDAVAAVGQFVVSHPRHWEVVTYDAYGRVVDRLTEG